VRFKRRTVVASVAVVAAAAVAAVTVHADASQNGDSSDKATVSAVPVVSSGGKGIRTVTLITGDSVRVDAAGQVVGAQRGPGRDQVAFSVHRGAGRTSVIPDDAAALVNAGTLDPALFDITGLLAAKYDDAHRTSLPLIVAYDKSSQRASAKSSVAAAGVVMKTSLPVINGDAVSEPKSRAGKVWAALHGPDSSQGKVSAGIARVWLDRKVTVSLDHSVPQIGAPDAWKAGFDGKGVTVAVLDTGVDRTHPDLADRVVTEKNFSAADNVDDHVGHGTHVASTIAGSGAASQGQYRGVAPGAKIISGKVLDDEGSGQDSDIIAGMSWAADQGAKVVNLSLGATDTPGIDPSEEAINTLSASKGMLFVVAAGNDGPNPETIGSPGSAADALTVGAVDRDDHIASFSSVGPTVDGAPKPDITAPGVGIVAARAAHGTLGTPVGTSYVAMSGTSMATPHVAGAAAIIAQEHPGYTGRQIKQVLMASAKPTPGLTVLQQGAGRVNLTQAITQTVVSSPALDFGEAQWPHNDDKPVVKTITYQNLGTASATVDLAVQTTAPDGMFALGTRQLTVPASGSASVDITADTRVGTKDGTFTATVVATSGAMVLNTALVVRREIESYNLNIVERDNAGKAAAAQVTVYHSTNQLDFWRLSTHAGVGTATIRLPKNDYTVESAITTGTGATMARSWLVQPVLSLNKDMTVVYAGSVAKPVHITAPGNAVNKGAVAIYDYAKPGGAVEVADGEWDPPSFDRFAMANVGSSSSVPGFSAQVAGMWMKGNARYYPVYRRVGSLFTGFTHSVDPSELALVKVSMGATAKGMTGVLGMRWTNMGDQTGAGFEPEGAVSLPQTVQAYVTTASGVKWAPYLYEQDADGSPTYSILSPFRRYEAKRTYSAAMNTAVIGPGFGADVDSPLGLSFRTGNEMNVCISLTDDGAGNDGVAVGDGTFTMTVDGKPLASADTIPCLWDAVEVPATTATYQINSDFKPIAGKATVSTRIISAWTFKSGPPPADQYVTLPLSAVRFTPALAPDNSAKAGTTLTVPITIEGAAASNGVAALSVDVSYDAGKTWKSTKVTTSNGKRSVTLNQPANAKSVSLRASLKDGQANTYSATIIQAYLLK